MNREQLEALWGQLTGDWTDPKAVQMAVDTLKSKAHWLFQGIFNQGHAAATAENKSTIERLEGELETAKTTAERERKAKEKAQEGNPDAAKVREELEGQISQLNDQLKAERDGRKQDKLDGALKRAEADLIAELSTRVDPVIARAHVHDPATQARLRAAVSEDGEARVEVLQKGLTIPMTHEKPLTALAEEIATAVPEKYHVSNADRGAGTRGGTGSGGTRTSVFDKIREEAAERNKEREERAAERTGAARLGVVGR